MLVKRRSSDFKSSALKLQIDNLEDEIGRISSELDQEVDRVGRIICEALGVNFRYTSK